MSPAFSLFLWNSCVIWCQKTQLCKSIVQKQTRPWKEVSGIVVQKTPKRMWNLQRGLFILFWLESKLRSHKRVCTGMGSSSCWASISSLSIFSIPEEILCCSCLRFGDRAPGETGPAFKNGLSTCPCCSQWELLMMSAKVEWKAFGTNDLVLGAKKFTPKLKI